MPGFVHMQKSTLPAIVHDALILMGALEQSPYTLPELSLAVNF